MGYNINIESTGTVAHRDNIRDFTGKYYNCQPHSDWIHIDVIPEDNPRGTIEILINGRNKRVLPCRTCQPWTYD